MPIVCLAKVSPLDPATGNRVDLYLSSADDSRVTGLNGLVWEPALTAAPTLSINLWQGDFQEPVDTGGASFGFNIGILKMTYPNADTYMWAGAPVEIYAEEPGTAWPWAQRFKGRVAGFSRRNQVVTINSKIDTEPFEKNVLTATYAGTTGAEGGADLKGRLKPLVIGWAKNVEPVLIDATNSVYQFSAYGAIEAVSVLYERATDFGASVGDYATYAALVAATIPAGRWGTCLAAGMVRLGAPAAGVITGDIRGHRVGGTTPRLTGAIISALATIAGVSAGNIESATLTALDAAVPYPVNLVLTEQAKFNDIAASMALACNWQSGITLQGKFFVLAVTLTGSEVLTLNAQGSALPQVTSSDEQDVSVPYYQTIFGANRCWRVQSSDEIAFTAALIPLGRYDPATSYREGNIVDVDDGSSWVYINGTASAGNAPPNWPTTSNSFWSNRTPPTGKRTTIGPSLPAAADSVPGDVHFMPDGTAYVRTGDSIVLGGFVITLGGFRPAIYWTLASDQPVVAAAQTANWSGITGTGKPEDNADVTSIITGTDITIAADFTGVVTSALPRTQSYKLVRNGVDLTASAAWSAAVLSGTLSASIGASTGVLSIDAIAGTLTSATVRLTAVYADTTRTFDVKITKENAAAPSTGGGGGSSASGSYSGNTSSTSMISIGPELNITIGSAGQAALSASYNFTITTGAPSHEFARWYRWNGSAYVAIGSEVQSLVPAIVNDDPGYGECNFTDTGLTAGSAQKYRLFMRSASGVNLRYVYGTAAAVGS